MDNNSTNDTDKRNWRERLGVGNKTMPRISEEFAKPAEPALVMPRATPRPIQPVAVAKPAPMAPRVAAKPASQIVRPQQQAPAQSARPMQPSSPQAPDVLADKLRSQRAAAEKLAEQRVMAARDRAENPKPTAAPPPPRPAQPMVQKPKFTFADDDARSDANRDQRPAVPVRPPQRPMQQAPLQPQLSPPRPNLGGDRPVAPQPRPNMPPPNYQPQFRPQPAQGYRPIDPATGYPPQSPRPYNQPSAPLNDPRLQQPRMSPEAYRRGPAQDDLGYPGASYEPQPRAIVRQEPLRATPAAEEDYSDDIFEEAPAPRTTRRASATDYNQVYRENEDTFGEEPRRSGGPWFLLLFFFLAAAAAGAGVWYYQTKIKPNAATSATSSETAPVVAAPETSAKVAPEQPAETAQPNAAAVTPTKKQIYDRIVGDKEVLGGQVVPTEEVPVQPAATPVPQPAGSAPQPAGDPLPLPMPPPPGGTNGTQGALPAPPGTDPVATADPTLNKSSTQTAAANNLEIPAAATTSSTTTGSAATITQASPPSDVAPASEEIVTEPVVKKKTEQSSKSAETEVKPKAKAKSQKALGAKPVVLVPPSEEAVAASNQDTQIVVDQPVDVQPEQTPAPAPVKKKKTLFGLFNGTNDQVAAAETAPVEVQNQVVATPEPAPAKKAAAQTQVASNGASGYYVQLASFKSQAEASTEYGRMKAKHPDILGGLPPVINPATVGGSTRYRLALGPLGSRDKASSICNSLVSAGERDCLVRKQ